MPQSRRPIVNDRTTKRPFLADKLPQRQSAKSQLDVMILVVIFGVADLEMPYEFWQESGLDLLPIPIRRFSNTPIDQSELGGIYVAAESL